MLSCFFNVCEVGWYFWKVVTFFHSGLSFCLLRPSHIEELICAVVTASGKGCDHRIQRGEEAPPGFWVQKPKSLGQLKRPWTTDLGDIREKYAEWEQGLSPQMRRRILQPMGGGEMRRWNCKGGHCQGKEMGGSVPTFGAWALGRWQPPGRFHDVQLHRGQVHYFLAELYHGGGSKGLGKRFLHETPRWIEPPTEFPVSNEVWEEQKDSCASRRAQMQQRDLKGTQRWNGLGSNCVDHQLRTMGNAHLLAQWHWHWVLPPKPSELT